MEVPRYSLAERDRRWALARKLMATGAVDALIACGGHEHSSAVAFAPDAYFSNDLPGSVVIFCGDTDPVQLAWPDRPGQTYPEAAGRGDQTWIDPARIRARPALRPGASGAGIAEVLREHHLEHAAVGVIAPDFAQPPHLSSGLPCPPWRDVLAELPGVTFKPVGERFMLAAACLSAEELAVLRYTAAAGDAMVQAMLAAAVPGVTEAEVYAAGTAAALRLGCQAPAMPMWSGPGDAAWGQPGWCYRPEPPRLLSKGDVLLAGPVSRLGMLETRHPVTVTIGDPHPDVETAAVIARACYQAGVSAARAGTTVGDLAEAMLAPLKVSGARSMHPHMHAVTSVGPGIAPIAAEVRLAPGMAWSFGPSAMVGSQAVTLGGTVVISENGPVELTARSAQLQRVIKLGRPTASNLTLRQLG